MADSLSVAMIVKNEAELLPECLAELQGFASEICVVDTGSTDGTVSIAESYGCRIEHFTWCNDFAAARNVSLKLCTHPWILVLDADERIAPADRDALRGLCGQGQDRCYRLTTRNYTNAVDLADFVPSPAGEQLARGFAGWYPSVKVRLFPNGLGARFEGKVHELVNQSLTALGVSLLSSDIPVHHYPLLKPAARIQEKQALYLALGAEKLRERPEDPRLAGELAAQYAEIGDYANAARLYREALRREPQNARWMEELGALLHLLGRSAEGLKALQLAVKLDPASANAWRNLGVVCAAMADWAGAVAAFERAAALLPDHSEAQRQLGVALAGMGRPEEAAAAAATALRVDARNEQALLLYASQMEALSRGAEARRFLQSLTPSPCLDRFPGLC